MQSENTTHKQVKEYYGETLETNSDLKTDACCSIDSYEPHVKQVLGMVHEKVHEKFYGCGSPIPQAVEGITAIDLGCGSGRDCFVLSKLVGESGKVIGIDMTDEQLSVALDHVPYHTERFGYKKPNVEFRKGLIEDLNTVELADNSVDLVVSNCVINLSPDKEKVFSEIFRVLKPGGELYFSDIFSSRRIPENLQNDPVLRGECLGGALYVEDFRRLLNDLGCKDFRTVVSRPLGIENDKIAEILGHTQFISATVRAFKLDSLEDRCEDFGQVATYKGGIETSQNHFILDDHHLFEKDRPMLVCGNSAAMLAESRFGKFFQIDGDKSKHFGLFDCEPTGATSEGEGSCC